MNRRDWTPIYTNKYSGGLFKIVLTPGTSDKLNNIAVAANTGILKIFPNFPLSETGWAVENVQLKLEGKKAGLNNGFGVVSTLVGKGAGLELLNKNILIIEEIKVQKKIK